jgi:hypothetical protein
VHRGSFLSGSQIIGGRLGRPHRVAAMPVGPKFGFYYAAAGIPILEVGMAGPNIFHASAEVKRGFFLGCVVLAATLIIVGGIKEANQEEESDAPDYRRRMIANIGMIVCELGFAYTQDDSLHVVHRSYAVS